MKESLLKHYFLNVFIIYFSRSSIIDKLKIFWRYTALTFFYGWYFKILNKKHGKFKINGCILEFDNWRIFRLLFEEIFIYRIYKIKLKESPYIIDCGSNIGMSILFFKDIYPLATITGFEPDPGNFEKLLTNITSNFPDVVLLNKAVSNVDGIINLFTINDTLGALTKTMYKNYLSGDNLLTNIVESVTLSNFLTQKVDLLKLDVEGAENVIIPDLINNKKISYIEKMIIEYHQIPGNNLSNFIKQLEENGFVVSLIPHPLSFFNKAFQESTLLIYAKQDYSIAHETSNISNYSDLQ